MTRPVPHVGNRWSGVSVRPHGTNIVRRTEHDQHVRRCCAGTLFRRVDAFYRTPTLHALEALEAHIEAQSWRIR